MHKTCLAIKETILYSALKKHFSKIKDCLSMAVCIHNSSWKGDLYLMRQLREHNSKGMRLREILSYMKRDFSQYQ